MRYKVKSIAALQMALGGLPDKMRVEVDPGIQVSAKTVRELRTVAGRFTPRKYQAPPAIAMSATITAPSNTEIERCVDPVGLVGFACAALPTSSE
jgi:hypothetical protein